MVVQIDFFLCQIKILHLRSFERPYIVSLKKYNYMLFSTPVAMEIIQDGHQTTFLKNPYSSKDNAHRTKLPFKL